MIVAARAWRGRAATPSPQTGKGPAWASPRRPRKRSTNSAPKWSPDFDAYASGQLDISKVRCALCTKTPCECPPFGSDEYFALLDQRHGH